MGKGAGSLVSSQFDYWNSHGEKRKPTHVVHLDTHMHTHMFLFSSFIEKENITVFFQI